MKKIFRFKNCRACPERSRRGFTLIELMVVIAIIVILSGIALVTYNGVQKTARDTQRKSDLVALGNAYKVHYQDKKIWNFDTTELSKVGSSATIEGSAGWGFVTYTPPAAPSISINDALVKTGYLATPVFDPSMGTAYGWNGANNQYMKFFCYTSSGISGIVLGAALESPEPLSTYLGDPSLSECKHNSSTGPSLVSTVNSTWHINYFIRIR